MNTTIHRTEVAVIGAGPAGLFTVFQCGMLNMRCLVVDALESVGGQCQALYPEKPIYDVPACPAILAGDLVRRLEEQAAPFHPTYFLGQRVVTLGQGEGGRWLLETDKGTRIEAAAVVIAAGVGAFGPNRPPLAGIEAYEGLGEGRGVNYLVARREAFRGKRVVIAGGGDSAVDWALSLSEVAASVAVIHRRPKFRAAPDSAAKLAALAEQDKVDLVIPYQLSGLEGEGELTAVRVADLDGKERRLEADVLLPFFGLSQDIGPIGDWGLTLEGSRIKVDPATCNAGRPGIFAVGDIAAYPGKLKLILSGFADAALASHAAFAVVHPGEALHFEHSTSRGVPAGS